MRFPSAYYLMLIYLTVMFKPIIPVIRDMYAHTFGEAIHLATVHAKYGGNHLDKSLAKTGDDNKDQKNNAAGESYVVHLSPSACVYDFHFVTLAPDYFLRRFNMRSSNFCSILVPPPRH